jgi:hypothetical protein
MNAREEGTQRARDFAAWLAGTGRDPGDMDEGELRLLCEAWNAAHAKYTAAPEGGVYARLTWLPRWTAAEVTASLSQDAAEVMAAGFFGTLMFRLDDGSAPVVARSAQVFADMVAAAQARFDGAGEDPFDPPRTSYPTATRQGLLAARNDLSRRLAAASVRRG